MCTDFLHSLVLQDRKLWKHAAWLASAHNQVKQASLYGSSIFKLYLWKEIQATVFLDPTISPFEFNTWTVCTSAPFLSFTWPARFSNDMSTEAYILPIPPSYCHFCLPFASKVWLPLSGPRGIIYWECNWRAGPTIPWHLSESCSACPKPSEPALWSMGQSHLTARGCSPRCYSGFSWRMGVGLRTS